MKNQINDYLEDLKEVINKFSVDDLEKIIEIIITAYNKGSNIFVMGNGGCAATASHLACDLNKGVSYNLDKRFKVICLNDNIPTMTAYSNDIAYEDIFVEPLKNFIEKEDLVIAFSGSGCSKNVLKAVEFANKYGAVTIGLTGMDGGRLANLSQYSLIVKSPDMQKIEDVHLIISHILMQVLLKKMK